MAKIIEVAPNQCPLALETTKKMEKKKKRVYVAVDASPFIHALRLY